MEMKSVILIDDGSRGFKVGVIESDPKPRHHHKVHPADGREVPQEQPQQDHDREDKVENHLRLGDDLYGFPCSLAISQERADCQAKDRRTEHPENLGDLI